MRQIDDFIGKKDKSFYKYRNGLVFVTFNDDKLYLNIRTLILLIT